MTDQPLKFFIKIVTEDGNTFDVSRGEVGNPLSYIHLLNTRDYRDAARAYTAAIADLNPLVFELAERASTPMGGSISIYKPAGEFRWNEDADWYDDNNDGA